MIKLTKAQKPNVLVQHAQAWTSELRAQIDQGLDPKDSIAGRYRAPEIKDALKRETHGKCAYCESKPLHVTHGDVEHIVPKSAHPDLTFEWDNLTLACDKCNTKKGSREGYVDPYRDDPEDEFEWDGPMIWHRHGKLPAERTHVELELNRGELIEKRAERLKVLRGQLDRLKATQETAAREFLIRSITEIETSADKEFAACVRRWVGNKTRAGELGV